jgi:putative component of toxin-antitoxin plasmid stabilization module
LDSVSRVPVLVSALVYLVFCTISLQGPDDLIPLVPYVAIFAAVAIVRCLDSTADLLFKLVRQPSHMVIKQTSYFLILCWILLSDFASASAYELREPHLREQVRAVNEMTSHLGPGDRIFAHGNLQVLVLSGLRNADRHIFLDRGKDHFMDRVEPGGFTGWLTALKDTRPRIVVLRRIKNVDRQDEIMTWVQQEYEVRDNGLYKYYLRKQNL